MNFTFDRDETVTKKKHSKNEDEKRRKKKTNSIPEKELKRCRVRIKQKVNGKHKV